VAKILYKPIGLLLAVLGSVLAGVVFRRIWPGDDKTEATDARKSWGEVLAAAVVQGAVYGGIKAAVDRAGATGYAKLTGAWPGRTKS
jgi:hypothetical protein